ncbi:GRAM domain-containing protein [Streptomyces sp. SL54]|uniref:GRAM domain-containing protein n=2 Tax=Streptantibioticus silvisoli TaxID=2705255 RepID=A0ABT6VSA2_9ACTN|nr:GRAM domain-containing protein [Streptantibioticus silvisoli]MDI5961363.1 GRAM domain-containing protein [Streptantibioticus silvisoli]
MASRGSRGTRRLTGAGLLPGERVVLGRNARMLPGTDEAEAGEVVAGRLYLTDYRLVFRARTAHVPYRTVSVLLPTVKDIRRTAAGRKWRVDFVTGTQCFTFVVRGVLRLIAETVLRVDADPAQVKRLAGLALADVTAACGDPTVLHRIHAETPAPSGLTPGDAHLIESAGATNLAELLRDERCG